MRYVQSRSVHNVFDGSGCVFLAEFNIGMPGYDPGPTIRWCVEHWGQAFVIETRSAADKAGHRWGISKLNDIWVRDKDDAFAFKMRWC